jgi:hypothetical protein
MNLYTSILVLIMACLLPVVIIQYATIRQQSKALKQNIGKQLLAELREMLPILLPFLTKKEDKTDKTVDMIHNLMGQMLGMPPQTTMAAPHMSDTGKVEGVIRMLNHSLEPLGVTILSLNESHESALMLAGAVDFMLHELQANNDERLQSPDLLLLYLQARTRGVLVNFELVDNLKGTQAQPAPHKVTVSVSPA